MAIDLTPPPISFATGDLYCNFLRIGWSEAFSQYFIYDHKGFLCRTDDLADVAALCRAESERQPDPTRRFYRRSARDVIDPGFAERYEQEMIENEKKLNEYNASQRAKRKARAETKVSGMSGADLLSSLGLVPAPPTSEGG